MCLGNQSPMLQQQTRKGRKAVRFPSSKNMCNYREGLTELTEQMILDVWYQQEDFLEFRRTAAITCDEAIRKGLVSFIKRTYSYSDLKTQHSLDLWAKFKDTSRGLERFINKDYAKERLYIRKKQIKGVLYTQEQLIEDGETDPVRSAAIIRNVATVVSEKAVIFAAMLGSADRAAVVHFMPGSSGRQSMGDMGKQNQTPPVEDTKNRRKGLQLHLERQTKGLEDSTLHSLVSQHAAPSKKNEHAMVDMEALNACMIKVEC
jgi:hypothetical protein